jgi:hypothetical protein
MTPLWGERGVHIIILGNKKTAVGFAIDGFL